MRLVKPLVYSRNKTHCTIKSLKICFLLFVYLISLLISFLNLIFSLCRYRSTTEYLRQCSSQRNKFQVNVELRPAICPHACAQSFGRVRLSATPRTEAHRAPLSTEFSRQEYWSGLPFSPPGDLPDPGIEATSPAAHVLAKGFFTTEPPGKPRRWISTGEPRE